MNNNNSEISENKTYPFLTKFENKDIINTIRLLNVDKACGDDNISIRMLKICDTTIVETLSIIFNNCIIRSKFRDIWKKLNNCPFHKKCDKQTINIYNSL